MPIITEVQITALSFPLAKPFSNHVRKITNIKGIYIKIITSADIIGHGFIYGLSDMPHKQVIDILENKILAELFSKNQSIENADQLMSHWQESWSQLKPQFHSQWELTALAIVDIAVWDIFIRAKNTSLHRFLGAAQNKLPVYGTTGWLSLSLDGLVAECKEYKDKEVKAFKIRLGQKDDVLRVKSVREAMGDEYILMLDANQRYKVEEAIEVSKILAPFKMHWIEEPTENCLEKFSQIKQKSAIPVALGENIIEEKDFQLICQKKLTDILQPDLPRCGGITGFIRVAELAVKHGIPICNHLLYELSLSIVAAFKNGYMIEYDNLLPLGIYTHTFKVKDGYLKPPGSIGTGVELTDAALKKYALATYTIQNRPMLRCRL